MYGAVIRCALVVAMTAAVTTSAPASTYQVGLIMADEWKSANSADVMNAVTSAFLDSRRFQPIERDRLDALLTERDFQDFIHGTGGDLSDLEGVDLIGLVNHETDFDQREQRRIYFLSVRLTDIKTGHVIAMVSSRRDAFEAPTSLDIARRYLLANLREEFPPEGSIQHIANGEITIDIGLESGLKDGDELEVLRDGELIFHHETGKPLLPTESTIGVLKVKTASRGVSVCVPTRGLRRKRGNSADFAISDRVRLKPKLELARKAYAKVPFLKRKKKEAESEF